jgi:hypothetical protein
MAGGPDRAHVRLAELVAALSLGVDLGFGQPTEHVLRAKIDASSRATASLFAMQHVLLPRRSSSRPRP